MAKRNFSRRAEILKRILDWNNRGSRTNYGRFMENGYIESFNGRLRDECLNVNQFLSLEHARSFSKPGVETTITAIGDRTRNVANFLFDWSTIGVNVSTDPFPVSACLKIGEIPALRERPSY